MPDDSVDPAKTVDVSVVAPVTAAIQAKLDGLVVAAAIPVSNDDLAGEWLVNFRSPLGPSPTLRCDGESADLVVRQLAALHEKAARA